ncbi:hypothetical protein ACIPVK_17055 [Paeniglutamicibacter sp. MACA_103]|uniref:hypothetical protein n=1 Tax=Paeniglutamicibacter sp. MACA_103 TaxID=3377337 RepID=UPI003893DA82
MPNAESAALTENFHPFKLFLPGGIPIHGNYARFGGTLYSSRTTDRLTGNGSDPQLVIIETGKRPGSEWELTLEHRGSSHTEWTKVIALSRAEETFRCLGTVFWRGLKMGGLDYLPEGNLIGGYLGSVPPRLQERLKGLRHLHQVDRSVWHGYVPLDEIEELAIRREPWPERPRAPWWEIPRGP